MNNRLPVSALIGEFVHTEEQLAQCRKFFEDCTPLFSRTANYFIAGDNNEVFTGRSCHYNTQDSDVGNPTLIATEVGAKRYSEPTKPFKVVKGVLDWMVNESPWSPAIVNKEDKLEDIYNTGIIFSTNVYFPFLQAGLIASRHFYEMPAEMFRKFDELVGQGIHKTLAFNAVFSCSSHLTGEWEVMPYVAQTTHRAFYVSRSAEIENMVSGFIGAALSKTLSKNKLKTYYDGSRDYIGGLYVYYDTGINDSHPITLELPWNCSLTLQPALVRKMIRDHRYGGKDVTLYAPPNPFNRARAAAASRADQISNEEFYKVIVPYLNTFAIAAAAVKEEKDIKNAA